MAKEQQKDSQLQNILTGSCPTSLVLQPLPAGQPPVTLHCYVSMDRIRAFVPEIFRREIFNNLQALSHPGVRASLKMVAERFGPPLRLTTDQGTQFEAYVFDAQSKLLGKDRRHTNPIPSSHKRPSGEVSSAVESSYNGTRKCSVDYSIAHHTHGFRATWKEDLQATLAEMIYVTPIRLPGEFLSPSKPRADPVTFVGRLRESMQRLSPPDDPISWSTYNLREQLFDHVQPDSLRKGLQPPYEGHYKFVDRTEKVFRILRHGKEVSMRIDRRKPAYIPKELEDIPVEVNVKEKVFLQTEEVPDSGQEKPRKSSSRQQTTARSGRRVRFNPKYC
ncbi:transposon Ty3-I Gag-Pol polyprotein [Trichonephila clavata]|uniref:Transposon Ty3-I Gag-Pol polyprotein n=1 Tax=Trichonephila clavata TaxID=2740835 RepID=A0A8X6J3W4_TRICU|nr:transposon Ty3-I Gag-Pol polyprotein [Trichonephila clavata]